MSSISARTSHAAIAPVCVTLFALSACSVLYAADAVRMECAHPRQTAAGGASAWALMRRPAALCGSALALRDFYRALPSPRPPPTPIRIDSTTAIKMINNPDEVSNRTKHINISYHWIRDAAQSQLISTKHVSGEENVADIFTKPLGPQRHKQLALRLGLRPSSDRVR